MKTVKVISTRTSQVVAIETEATTWGELKAQLSEDARYADIDWSKTSVFLKATDVEDGRKSLVFDEASISNESVSKLFISPSQMKAGSSDMNNTRYSDAKLREWFTIAANIIEDLLDEPAAQALDANTLTAEDQEEINRINGLGR